MKRISWIIIIGIFAITVSTSACYAKSFSAEYTIQVYIPPIVGVNVPDDNASDSIGTAAKNQSVLTFEESLVRNGKIVICKTTVLK